MSQLIEHQTLNVSPDHDPRVVRLSPVSGSALGIESAYDSPSPSIPSLPSLSLSPSPPPQQISRIFKKKKKIRFSGDPIKALCSILGSE